MVYRTHFTGFFSSLTVSDTDIKVKKTALNRINSMHFTDYHKKAKDECTVLPPCRICGAKASGFHYGVNSCEACKGFFRRALKRPMVLHCTKSKKCDVKGNKRSNCRFCRYNRCIGLGMSRESIKTGRYSHTKRTMDTIEVKQLQNSTQSLQYTSELDSIVQNVLSAHDSLIVTSIHTPQDLIYRRQLEYHNIFQLHKKFSSYLKSLNKPTAQQLVIDQHLLKAGAKGDESNLCEVVQFASPSRSLSQLSSDSGFVDEQDAILDKNVNENSMEIRKSIKNDHIEKTSVQHKVCDSNTQKPSDNMLALRDLIGECSVDTWFPSKTSSRIIIKHDACLHCESCTCSCCVCEKENVHIKVPSASFCKEIPGEHNMSFPKIEKVHHDLPVKHMKPLHASNNVWNLRQQADINSDMLPVNGSESVTKSNTSIPQNTCNCHPSGNNCLKKPFSSGSYDNLVDDLSCSMDELTRQDFASNTELTNCCRSDRDNVRDFTVATDGITSSNRVKETKEEITRRSKKWIEGYISFAQKIPGFQSLPVQDQISLLKCAWDEVWILGTYRGYSSDLGVAMVPSGKCFHVEEMERAWGKNYTQCVFKLADIIKGHKLTSDLTTLLKVICIVSPDRCLFADAKRATEIHWTMISCLLRHLEMTYPGDRMIFPRLVSVLTAMRDLSESARKDLETEGVEFLMDCNILSESFTPF